ncbi:magnesium and cobalt transport protein CorA [Kineococcus sp. SYSU DK005]|uniref:magnesium and cobalt transport protein CorA n=1 Tax=Kineococcus sp. SYSU DK005 TaxID=3383126 RepID=UPI003D7D2E3F
MSSDQRVQLPPPGAPQEVPQGAGHASPGLLSGLPVVRCELYEPQSPPRHVQDPAAALEAARAAGGFLWIGLHGTDADHVARLQRIFDLPALAVEDAVNAHQRPKFERYPGMTFAVLKPVRYVDHEEVVDVSEVAVFLGEHFVITVRHGESRVVADVRAEVDAAGAERPVRPGHVLYRLLDSVVDGYTEVVQAIAVDVEEIEEKVFSSTEEDHAERIYKLKREVLEFRRAVSPLIAPVQRLAEGGPGGEDDRHRYRDVLDHLLRAADAIDGYDRLLTDILQAHLTQVGVRQSRVTAQQNEDMRRISAWAAIALVPTAIAGIYGMNFDNMPELHTRYGYFAVLAVILGACTTLYLTLRAKKWL